MTPDMNRALKVVGEIMGVGHERKLRDYIRDLESRLGIPEDDRPLSGGFIALPSPHASCNPVTPCGTSCSAGMPK